MIIYLEDMLGEIRVGELLRGGRGGGVVPIGPIE
jgi:hypothetical protein